MGLNKSKDNMYPWVTHTWNTIKGKCPHNCVYCYMKTWGELPDIHFDEKELKTDLGSGNIIFVGNSNDMFADTIPNQWINKTIAHCRRYSFNSYVFQTKNVKRLYYDPNITFFPEKFMIGTTIETNRDLSKISRAPSVIERSYYLSKFAKLPINTFITIEPIMEFDFEELYSLIYDAQPNFVNIGADSKGHKLPEPSYDKVLTLINTLKNDGIEVRTKKNLNRLKFKK